MQLTFFIHDLLKSGQVTVARQLKPFTDEDIQQTEKLLKQHYAGDKLELPLEAPEFSPEAALWAAKYLYHAIQFVMIRDLGEEEVKKHLTSFEGQITPNAVYAADLLLRYLPDLLSLAKGLAPDDILVTCLKQTLAKWPFSSTGLPGIEADNEEVILAHPSLKYAYIDRIIICKDTKRASKAQIAGLIEEVLGGYAHQFWPEFENKKYT
jgi:hypothetical protein